MSELLSKLNADPTWADVPVTAPAGRWMLPSNGGSGPISSTIVTVVAELAEKTVNAAADLGGDAADCGEVCDDPALWDIPPG